MTRAELRVLSDAHAVAMLAMVAEETRQVPFTAAFAVYEAVRDDLPGFEATAARFVEELRSSRFDPVRVAAAGRALRDDVARFMAFVPRDIDRVDIHG